MAGSWIKEMTARYLATLPDPQQGEKMNEAFGGVLETSMTQALSALVPSS